VESININSDIQLTFNQLIQLLKSLPTRQKQILKDELNKDLKVDDKVLTHYASEEVLAKDWMLNEEDIAWKDL